MSSETASASASPQTWAPPPITRRTWLAFTVLILGMAMAMIDTTIVNVALPTIQKNLDADEATLSWIISGYALAFGLALIPAGRLGDRIGHKWVFIFGLTGFTLASLWCGLAADSNTLIIARVVQGLMAGIFVPAVTAMIQLMFPGRERGTAFAIFGATIGFATALGPIIGGLLIEWLGEDSGWRSIFFVNLPIGIVAVIGASTLLPNIKVAVQKTGLDILGLILLAGGLIAILVPLIQGQDAGWPLWTYLSIGAGVVFLVLFGLWEVFLARRGANPLVPPHLFRHGAFTGGTILAFVYFAAFTSIFFTISIFWQAGLGHTALESGLVSVPFAIGSIVGAALSDNLAGKLGRGVLLIGTALVSLGLIAVWLVVLLVPSPELTSWDLLPALLLAGFGSGLFIAPNASFIVATVDRSEAGAASGVVNTVQRIGSAVGIAIIGSVFFGSLVFPTDHQPSPDDVANAFGVSAANALLVSALFAVASFFLVFVLPKRVNRGWDEAPRSE